MIFKLAYRVRNGGDGSASVDFHQSRADAQEAEERDDAECGEGWAEPSDGELTLKIEKGIIYFEDYDDEGKVVWKPLHRQK